VIIDYDKTQRTGRVVPLAQMPDVLDETVPIRTVTVEEVRAASSGRAVGEKSTVTGRPREENGRFMPASSGAGMVLYDKCGNTERNEHESAGVVLTKTPEDTGTHALPAVERMTGKPSTAIDLHRTARRIQDAFRFLGVAVWYGEYTKEFWVMNQWDGLQSFRSVTDLYQGMGWQAL
jgi:hypothetical protein